MFALRCSCLLLPLLALQAAAAEPPTWTTTATIAAPEAVQAAAADEQFAYAIASAKIAKYERETGNRVGLSTGPAEHLNSGFLDKGKLYCAHSNYPRTPERSEIKVLDTQSLELSTFKEFGNFGGSLTWVLRDGKDWWCNFARYGQHNAETFLVKFDGDWQETARWTYPPEVIRELGNYSLSGGIWRGDRLFVTGHDAALAYVLRLPKSGGVLEFVEKQRVPFTGQGIATDPKTGGLVGIQRGKSVIVFARAPEAPLPAPDKFHLYLLIGQSNMAGRGKVDSADNAPPPRVYKFTKEQAWVPATDPLHFDKPIAGVGLGTAFGRVMAEADQEIAIGLIPCAVGGTPLSRWQKGGDLYQQAVARAKAAQKQGTLRGILWHQGESDAGSEATAKNYAERLSGMVRDLRSDLDAPDAPFVAGELGHFLAKEKSGKPSYWPMVNEQLHLLPGLVEHAAVASSRDLKPLADQVHFDSASLREFGQRYAEAMLKLQTELRKGR